MRKLLVTFLTFLLSAVLGSLLTAAIAFAVAEISLAMYRRDRPGVGAVAGGLGYVMEAAVLMVPLLSGIIGVLWVRRHSLP